MPWERTKDIVRGNNQWHASAKSFELGGEVKTVTLHWWRRDSNNIGQEHSEITIPADVFEEIVAFVQGDEVGDTPSLAQQVDELMWRHKNRLINDGELKRGIAALSETSEEQR